MKTIYWGLLSLWLALAGCTKGVDDEPTPAGATPATDETPLELLLAEGIRVTACDKRSREQMGKQAEHLEQLGCELHLGADYLKDLDADVIFRTPGLRPDVPELSACVQKGAVLTSEMEVF